MLIVTLYFLSCKESEKSNNTSKLYSWTATIYPYKSGELSEKFEEQISIQLINNDEQFKIRYSNPEKHLLKKAIFDHIDTSSFKDPESHLEHLVKSNFYYFESASEIIVYDETGEEKYRYSYKRDKKYDAQGNLIEYIKL